MRIRKSEILIFLNHELSCEHAIFSCASEGGAIKLPKFGYEESFEYSKQKLAILEDLRSKVKNHKYCYKSRKDDIVAFLFGLNVEYFYKYNQSNTELEKMYYIKSLVIIRILFDLVCKNKKLNSWNLITTNVAKVGLAGMISTSSVAPTVAGMFAFGVNGVIKAEASSDSLEAEELVTDLIPSSQEVKREGTYRISSDSWLNKKLKFGDGEFTLVLDKVKLSVLELSANTKLTIKYSDSSSAIYVIKGARKGEASTTFKYSYSLSSFPAIQNKVTAYDLRERFFDSGLFTSKQDDNKTELYFDGEQNCVLDIGSIGYYAHVSGEDQIGNTSSTDNPNRNYQMSFSLIDKIVIKSGKVNLSVSDGTDVPLSGSNGIKKQANFELNKEDNSKVDAIIVSNPSGRESLNYANSLKLAYSAKGNYISIPEIFSRNVAYPGTTPQNINFENFLDSDSEVIFGITCENLVVNEGARFYSNSYVVADSIEVYGEATFKHTFIKNISVFPTGIMGIYYNWGNKTSCRLNVNGGIYRDSSTNIIPFEFPDYVNFSNAEIEFPNVSSLTIKDTNDTSGYRKTLKIANSKLSFDTGFQLVNNSSKPTSEIIIDSIINGILYGQSPSLNKDIPTAPSNLQVFRKQNNFNLTWESSMDSNGIKNYEVYYKLKNEDGGDINSWVSLGKTEDNATLSFNYDITALKSTGEFIQFKVVAYDTLNTVGKESLSLDFPLNSTPEVSNVVYAGTDKVNSQGRLSWFGTDSDNDSLIYRVYEITTQEGSDDEIKQELTTGGAISDSFIEVTIPNAKTVRWEVIADDGTGKSNALSSVATSNPVTVTFNSPPKDLTSINAVKVSSNVLNVSWSETIDVDDNLAGYELEYQVKDARENPIGSWNALGSSNSLSFMHNLDQTILDGTNTFIQYRVRAIDKEGSTSNWIESADVQFMPQVKNAKAITATKIEVTFDDGSREIVDLTTPMVTGDNEITLQHEIFNYTISINYLPTLLSYNVIDMNTIEFVFTNGTAHVSTINPLATGDNEVTFIYEGLEYTKTVQYFPFVESSNILSSNEVEFVFTNNEKTIITKDLFVGENEISFNYGGQDYTKTVVYNPKITDVEIISAQSINVTFENGQIEAIPSDLKIGKNIVVFTIGGLEYSTEVMYNPDIVNVSAVSPTLIEVTFENSEEQVFSVNTLRIGTNTISIMHNNVRYKMTVDYKPSIMKTEAISSTRVKVDFENGEVHYVSVPVLQNGRNSINFNINDVDYQATVDYIDPNVTQDNNGNGTNTGNNGTNTGNNGTNTGNNGTNTGNNGTNTGNNGTNTGNNGTNAGNNTVVNEQIDTLNKQLEALKNQLEEEQKQANKEETQKLQDIIKQLEEQAETLKKEQLKAEEELSNLKKEQATDKTSTTTNKTPTTSTANKSTSSSKSTGTSTSTKTAATTTNKEYVYVPSSVGYTPTLDYGNGNSSYNSNGFGTSTSTFSTPDTSTTEEVDISKLDDDAKPLDGDTTTTTTDTTLTSTTDSLESDLENYKVDMNELVEEETTTTSDEGDSASALPLIGATVGLTVLTGAGVAAYTYMRRKNDAENDAEFENEDNEFSDEDLDQLLEEQQDEEYENLVNNNDEDFDFKEENFMQQKYDDEK